MLVSRSICCSCSNITMSFEPHSIDSRADQKRSLGFELQNINLGANWKRN
jgi:hypothetical protein